MIRLIIICAIFYAGYQIGTQGFDQFMSSINIDGILNSVSGAIAWLDSIVQSMKGTV